MNLEASTGGRGTVVGAKTRRGSFRSATGGSVAVIFALSSVVLGGMSGLAIDYSRYLTTRKAMQAVTDQIVIRVAAENATESAVQELGSASLAALWDPVKQTTTATVVMTKPSETEYKAVTSTELTTTFMKILGIPKVHIQTSAIAAFGQNKAEVALALDVTSSMSGTKIDSLKTAAKLLVDTAYEPAGSENRVKFSLVPFSDYVNVGTMYRNSMWMSVPSDTSSTTNQCYTTQPVVGTSNCQTMTGTAYNDGVPYTYTYQQCDYQYGPPTTTCSDVTTTNTWYGCAGSRAYPRNLQKTADSANPIPGVMNVLCPQALQRLTNSASVVKAAIDDLSAVGNTYIPSGLTWAWRTLSSTTPFQDGDTKASTRKVIVLMTDGANTLSPTYPAHNGNDTATTDTLLGELCTNIKNDNVQIYAVAFEVTDQNIKDRLKACATTVTHYFDAASASELTSAFEKIGKQLSSLHLKQ